MSVRDGRVAVQYWIPEWLKNDVKSRAAKWGVDVQEAVIKLLCVGMDNTPAEWPEGGKK